MPHHAWTVVRNFLAGGLFSLLENNQIRQKGQGYAVLGPPSPLRGEGLGEEAGGAEAAFSLMQKAKQANNNQVHCYDVV
jgi:hypothetical protein